MDAVVVAGLFHTAEAWRPAAMALVRPKLIGHAEKPVRFLSYQALELYLKGLLRQKHSVQILNKFGHNIKRPVQEAGC